MKLRADMYCPFVIYYMVQYRNRPFNEVGMLMWLELGSFHFYSLYLIFLTNIMATVSNQEGPLPE